MVDKYKIAVLAEDVFTKEQRVRMLEQLNTPSDFEERKKARIELEIARAELFEAQRALEHAKTFG
jgi:hypothetical protein